jgi:signal transduction histidine kinase
MWGAFRLFRHPELADADLQRQGRLAMSAVRAMSVAVVGLIVGAMFEARNEPLVTLAFYLPILAGLAGGAALLHRGQVRLVGWGLALLVWAAVTVALLIFGGLKTNTAMPFVIALTIAGTIAGARAAVWVGALSVASSTVTLLLEESGRLPAQLMPPTPGNGYLAVVFSLGISAWFLFLSLESLERALAAERRAAQERDLAHARALQSQRLETVGRLTAGVAHDLANLLGVVTLAADGLRESVKTQPALAPLLEDLSHATDQATLLSRRMLAMSRAQGSPAEPLEAGQVVEQFAPLLRRLLPEETHLRIERKSPLPLEASRAALEHVVLNLVLNARDAMPKGGDIEVVVDERELRVRDQGVGMSREVQEKIFQPFFTTRENGTGLGLTNVAELAKSMHATVKVDSAPGQGSTFHVVFAGATVAPPPGAALR